MWRCLFNSVQNKGAGERVLEGYREGEREWGRQEEKEKKEKEGKTGGKGGGKDGGGRGRKVQVIMTSRNTLQQNHPKQLFDGPVGAGRKVVGRISCYLHRCQVSSLPLYQLQGCEIV